MYRDATCSPCRTWRYTLVREFEQRRLGDPLDGTLVFVLLNPATATADEDDPTTRRGVDYARRWGFERVEFVNLFAARTTDPDELRSLDDPVGPENDRHLVAACERADRIVCGWGNHGTYMARAGAVCDLIGHHDLSCLAVNETGAPAHPLYQPADAEPVPYERSGRD